MASGENIEIIDTGDEYFDFCCNRCSKKTRNRRASKYCVNCNEYFCDKCVRKHNSYSAMMEHVLVDPETTPSTLGGSKKTLYSVPTERCKRHHLKLVDMYCGDHDSVGCSTCFTLDHKSCKDTRYIPEYIQSNFPMDQINRINNDLTKAIKDMKKMKKQQNAFDDNLGKSKDKCKQEIQKYRDDLIHIIDTIVAASLAELDAIYKDTKKKAGYTNPNIQGVLDEMIRLKSEIESVQSNDTQKFVSAKLSQTMMKQGRELQSEIQDNESSEIQFTRNTDIMTFLISIATLGILGPPLTQEPSLSGAVPSKQSNATKSLPSLSNESNSRNVPAATRQQHPEVDKKAMKTSQQSLSDNSHSRNVSVAPIVVMKSNSRGRYKMVKEVQDDKHQAGDKKTCDIWSSCIVDSDDILLADYNNEKLKLVDSRTYTIKSSLALGASPWSVCRVSSKEAVICLKDCRIQFVSTLDDNLVPMRSLRMKHGYSCIAVITDKLYACDLKSVYIHTLNGELEQIIKMDKSGNGIFSNIWDITASDDEKRIHVADMDNGVITLNTDGHVVWRYCGAALRPARGVCTDGTGNVIVCGYLSNNVIQLSPDGQYRGEIVTGDDGVQCPVSVCYDRKNKKLFLGESDSNSITIFTIE